MYGKHISEGIITRGLISEAFIRGFYPRSFNPGGLRFTLTVYKDSTCFTRAERARTFAQINDNHLFHKLLYFL